MKIKTIIFDIDGMVLIGKKIFGQRLAERLKVPDKTFLPFFDNEFQSCLIGKSDLKEEIIKYLKIWKWPESLDDLLKFWFDLEGTVDQRIIKSARAFRSGGTKCYLSTNNEKYRVDHFRYFFKLDKEFDGLFASCNIGFKKPQFEFWNAIYNLLNSPDKTTVLVWDDDIKNVESARKFGFQAELYKNFDDYSEKMNSL